MKKFRFLLCLLLAITLLYLGTPRVVSSVLKVPAFPVILAVHDGEPQGDRQLDRAIDSLKAANRWEQSGRLYADLGALLLIRAAQTDPKNETNSRPAEEAALMLRKGLLEAPAMPYSWLRLAYARTIEGAEPQQIIELVQQSYRVGKYVGGATIPRVELLLRFWDEAPVSLRTLAEEQIRFAWRNEPGNVIEAALQSDKPQVFLNALETVPGALDQIEAALDSH